MNTDDINDVRHKSTYAKVVLTKLIPTWAWIVIDLPFSWWKDR